MNELLTSLRMFFWGGIICLLDVTIRKPPSGDGFRVDIFNDSIGMAIFIYGLFKLKKICQEFKYNNHLKFLLFVSAAYFIVTIHYHVIYSVPEILFVLLTVTIYCFYFSFFVAYVIMINILIQLGYRHLAMLWRANLYILAVAVLTEAIIIYITNVGPEVSLNNLWNAIHLFNNTIMGHRYRLYFPPFVQFIYTAPFIFSLFILYFSKKTLTKQNTFDNG